MKKHLTHILASFLAFAMIISLSVVPVYADYQSSTDSFFDRVVRTMTMGMTKIPLIGTPVATILFDSSTICTLSSDQLHRADTFYDKRDGKSGAPYLVCKCKYCGRDFFIRAENLSAAYDTYVSDIETDFGTTLFGTKGYYIYPRINYHIADNLTVSSAAVSANRRGITYTGIAKHSTIMIRLGFEDLPAPVAGYYTLVTNYSGAVPHYANIMSGDYPAFLCTTRKALVAGQKVAQSNVDGHTTSSYQYTMHYRATKDLFYTITARFAIFVEPYSYSIGVVQ